MGGWGQPPLPSGELGQLWEKISGYEKKFEKIVDGIGGFDTLSIPLMSDSKFYRICGENQRSLTTGCSFVW